MKTLFSILIASYVFSLGGTDSTNYILIRHVGNNYAPIPQIIIDKGDFTPPECGDVFTFCYSVSRTNFEDIENFTKKVKSDDTLDDSGNILFAIYNKKNDSLLYVVNHVHSKKLLQNFIALLKERNCDQRISMRVEQLMRSIDYQGR